MICDFMAKHPRYLAVDEARMKEIQRSFEEFCSDKYILEKEVKQVPGQPEGYLDFPEFTVKDEKGTPLAKFHSNGSYQLLEKKFKKIYNKMVKAIEKVAEKELKEVEFMERREHAEMHGFDPTFYQKLKEEEEKKEE
jgi:hypothetical protein